MAQDTSGTVSGTTAVVIPGEMAARIDRLPLSWVHWEIALVVQLAWAGNRTCPAGDVAAIGNTGREWPERFDS